MKKIVKVIIFVIIILVLVVGFLFKDKIFKKIKPEIINEKDMYVSSISLESTLYDLDFNENGKVVRGTKVHAFEKDLKNSQNESDENTYLKILYNDEEVLMLKNDLVSSLEECVLEKEKYVRTPVSIYNDSESVDIIGLINKGEKVEIIGFDKILENGRVSKYKIKYNETGGYIYEKYLVDTYEESVKNYDQDGIYQTHLARTDTQGGGSAGNLDYYPYEKPVFTNNVMPNEVRSLYLNGGVLGNLDDYIKLAKEKNINAFVVDIKDSGSPSYASKVMQELSPTNYNNAINSFESYQAAIKKIKDNGFYVIGRITVFKDHYFAQDHPEYAIVNSSSGTLFSHNGSYWPSAYQRKVWEFNVKLAREAVVEMGFNEIQFDYVRFPDRTYRLEANGVMNMRNDYNEEKAQAIQRFLMYACDEIHSVGAYVSADVFGESAYTYVAAYGQYWPSISNIVDVISAMPYPDHFNTHDFGISEVVWTVPYKLMYTWGGYAASRQKEIPTPAIVRTWIQAYDTIKSPYIVYDASKISDQIQGLYDAGLRGGYMTWNSGSSLVKYNYISSAFQKEY